MTDLETQPRSYPELVSHHIERHQRRYGFAVLFFCGHVFVLNMVLLYHLFVAPVSWIAAAEAEVGWTFAEKVIMPVVYVRMVGSFIGTVGGLMMIKRG